MTEGAGGRGVGPGAGREAGTESGRVTAPGAGHGAVEFAVERRVNRAPERVFEVLGDLSRHWPLLGSVLVEASMIDGDGGRRARLTLRMPPPLGLLGGRRTIETEVLALESPRLLRGRAASGASEAEIEWNVSEQPGGRATGSLVRFSAVISPGNTRDRLILRAARPWLARRGRRVLVRLDAAVIALDPPPAGQEDAARSAAEAPPRGDSVSRPDDLAPPAAEPAEGTLT